MQYVNYHLYDADIEYAEKCKFPVSLKQPLCVLFISSRVSISTRFDPHASFRTLPTEARRAPCWNGTEKWGSATSTSAGKPICLVQNCLHLCTMSFSKLKKQWLWDPECWKHSGCENSKRYLGLSALRLPGLCSRNGVAWALSSTGCAQRVEQAACISLPGLVDIRNCKRWPWPFGQGTIIQLFQKVL